MLYVVSLCLNVLRHSMCSMFKCVEALVCVFCTAANIFLLFLLLFFLFYSPSRTFPFP